MKANSRPGRAALWLCGLLILLCLAMLVSLSLGAVRIPPGTTLQLLWAPRGTGDPVLERVLLGVRLPRVLLAGLGGLALALCGGVMQGLFRNPLADPYLLGIASGATAGAALTIVLHLDQSYLWLPAGAFAGGLLAVGLVYVLAQGWARPGRSDASLVLTGVALSALFSALTSLLLYVSEGDDLRRIVFWLLGSLSGASWHHVLIVAALCGTCGPLLLYGAGHLNVLSLGDAMAQHLGLSPAALRRAMLVLVTLLTAGVVAVSGTIGFVGLIIPHAMRLVLGPDHRLLLPAAALCGAVFLLLCDTVARTALSPVELPVGVITALCGAPVFLYLLLRSAPGGRT